MNLVLNGLGTLGGVGFWRIDNLDEERVGLDFLAKPWALVRDKEAAEKIIAALNKPDTQDV